MRKLNLKFILLLAALITVLPSVADESERKYITIYTLGCGDPDIIDDLTYAINSITSVLKENEVTLIINETSKRCGYDLHEGDRLKKICEVLTDVDLMFEIADFYNFKIKG